MNFAAPSEPLLEYGLALAEVAGAVEGGRPADGTPAFGRAAAWGQRADKLLVWVDGADSDLALPSVAMAVMQLGRMRKLIVAGQQGPTQRLRELYDPQSVTASAPSPMRRSYTIRLAAAFAAVGWPARSTVSSQGAPCQRRKL